MSKQYDKRPAVRLEPETVNLLKKTLPKLPYRSSTPKIINDAARRGLPLLCPPTNGK